MKKILIFIVSLVFFTSCYTTRTTVGNYKQLEKQGLKTYQYDKDKQFYLFGGLIPLGHSHANTPNEPCEIKSKFKIGDLLISALTCEILTSRTVVVTAFEGGAAYPLQNPVGPQKQDVLTQENADVDDGKNSPTTVVKKTRKQEDTQSEQVQVPAEDGASSVAVNGNQEEQGTGEPVVVKEPESTILEVKESEDPIVIPSKETEPFVVTGEEDSTTPVQPIEEQPEVVSTEPSSAVNIENGAIIAPFTVGSTKKVYFSKGNLQYQASGKIWRFAEQQYDMIGSANSNISRSNSGWIDLFGWGTSGWDNRNTFYMPYETESASATYGYGYGPTDGQTYEYSLRGKYAESDWGVANVISEAGDSAGMWRTLTRSEWGYLLLKRPNAPQLYSLAMVNGVKGILILPDDWSMPGGLDFEPRTSFEINSYTLEQWKKLEAHGAVFLPTAGCRYGTTVGNVGTTGSYWTASASGGENAWYFVFNKGKIDILSDFSRALGRSVRLVQDIR